MNWFQTLFLEHSVANSLLIISLVIAVGLTLSKIKMGRVNLGVTWILFAGIAVGQLGLSIDATTAHFVKEFGLILFIYSIGIEVGPKFFAAFKSGGLLLNGLAAGIVLLGCLTAQGKKQTAVHSSGECHHDVVCCQFEQAGLQGKHFFFIV